METNILQENRTIEANPPRRTTWGVFRLGFLFVCLSLLSFTSCSTPPAMCESDDTCPTGQQCTKGYCVCPPSSTLCDNTCVDLLTDGKHCGACGNICEGGKTCTQADCQCPMSTLDCGGKCVDTTSDTAHCGACGNICSTGQLCNKGSCEAQCPKEQTRCGDGCFDAQTSTQHCGACDNACTPGQECVQGKCQCAIGRVLCGGACVDLLTDNKHCGGCDKSCTDSQLCASGRCLQKCPKAATVTQMPRGNSSPREAVSSMLPVVVVSCLLRYPCVV